MARELFDAQVTADRGLKMEGDELPNMVATFYPEDAGKASFHYARETYGIVVEPEVERIVFSP